MSEVNSNKGVTEAAAAAMAGVSQAQLVRAAATLNSRDAAIKPYAGVVTFVNRFEKSMLIKVQVYGFYNPAEPGTLIGREAREIGFNVAYDGALGNIGVKDRLWMPAKGISVKSREFEGKRGVRHTHFLVGLETSKIIVLNSVEVEDDNAYLTKSGISLTMAAAEDGVLQQVAKSSTGLLRNLWTSLIKS